MTIAGHSFGSQPPPPAAEAPPPAVAPPAPVSETPIGSAPATANAPQPGAEVPVALLLPLSGPAAALGQAMLDAAQMALYDAPGSRLQLLVRDTKGDPSAAAAAAQSALAAGAKLLLGPLLASEVEAVKPVAASANVPVVAFSTSTQFAGDGTYLLGFEPKQEIARVIAYARSQGRSRFALLAPQSPYGDLAEAALQEEVAAKGGQIVNTGRYAPDASPAELAAAVREFVQQGGDFDALLLPEGDGKLRQIAPLLTYDKVDPDKVKLIGTGLWDDPSLGAEPALDGGWYAAPDPRGRADFTKRFTALYHHAPPRLATLGYDATALAGVLARNPNGADFSQAAITNPSGFSGLDGIFRLLASGLVQRGLAVLQIGHDGPEVIDPAPTSFEAISE